MPSARNLRHVPTATSTTVVDDAGPVVALRERAVVTIGALLDRRPVSGSPLVNGRDLDGRGWWIPATGVWADAAGDGPREMPWTIGLQTSTNRHVAVLAGLSDRLGWEAETARRNGCRLPELEGLNKGLSEDTVILDGRLGHGVPTVLVVSERASFWGAGATLATAYHRAMYGDRGELGGRRELMHVKERLSDAGLDVVVVDLAPATISARVQRVSVQLML